MRGVQRAEIRFGGHPLVPLSLLPPEFERKMPNLHNPQRPSSNQPRFSDISDWSPAEFFRLVIPPGAPGACRGPAATSDPGFPRRSTVAETLAVAEQAPLSYQRVERWKLRFGQQQAAFHPSNRSQPLTTARSQLHHPPTRGRSVPFQGPAQLGHRNLNIVET